MKWKYFMLALMLACIDANAGNDTLDAAIGGGIGGAVGAAIGNELGGRNGAIIGGALGATAGAHIATDRDAHHGASQRNLYHRDAYRDPRYEYHLQRSGSPDYHCPPGQARKGRC